MKQTFVTKVLCALMVWAVAIPAVELHALAPTTSFSSASSGQAHPGTEEFITLKDFMIALEAIAQTEGRVLGPAEKLNLQQQLEHNAWAIRRGRLRSNFFYEVYFGSQHQVLRALSRLTSQGVQSFSQILLALERHPNLVERVCLDLDETLFTTRGHLGSDRSAYDEYHYYGKDGLSVRIEMAWEEHRLLDQGGRMFKTVEPGVAERLGAIQQRNPNLRIVGLTAREETRRENTEKILEQIGIDIPVIYAGPRGRKVRILMELADKRDREIAAENERRRAAALERLKAEGKTLPEDEDALEELLAQHVEYLDRGYWLFLDDRMDRISGPRQLQSMAAKRVLAFPYRYTAGVQRSSELAILSRWSSEDAQDRLHAVYDATDLLLGMRREEDHQKRLLAYRVLARMVREAGDDRLKMAFLESVSDFLERGMHERFVEAELDKVLSLYFGLLTPHATPTAWKEILRTGAFTVDRREKSTGRTWQPGANYEIVLNDQNIFFFLEPILQYLLEHKPDVIILPDTAARPFQGPIRYFLEQEGLDKTKVIMFPVSINAAHDTAYEFKRWMRLVSGDIAVASEEDEKLLQALKTYDLDALKGARSVAILDDNVVGGGTMAVLARALESTWGIERFMALTPFAYRDPSDYGFPLLASAQVHGEYAWKSGGQGIAPAVIVRTEWEYRKRDWRGASPRKDFQYPQAVVEPRSAKEYQGRLLEGFKKAYAKHRARLRDQGPPAGAEPVSATGASKREIALSKVPSVLPDSLVWKDYSLTRLREALPPWIQDQEAVGERDIPFLSDRRAAVYTVGDAQGREMGAVLLLAIPDGQDKIRLVLQKIMPKMEEEHRWDAVAFLRGLAASVKREWESRGIDSLMVHTVAQTMTGLSESHRVRMEIAKAYNFLPEGSLEAPLEKDFSKWVGRPNIFWKRLSDAEEKRLLEARKQIDRLAVLRETVFGRRLWRRVLGRDYFSAVTRLGKVVARGLPVSEEDVTFLEVLAKIVDGMQGEKKGLASALPLELEARRVHMTYEILLAQNEETGRPIEFSPGYFDVKDANIRRVRVEEAIRFFFTNLWENGGDVGRNLREEDLLFAGLGPIYKVLGGRKGDFLEHIAPGCYEFVGGRYVPREDQPVDAENIVRFLNGQWYAVAPGMHYDIGPEEQVSDTGKAGGFFKKWRGRRVAFRADPNFGVLGIVLSEQGAEEPTNEEFLIVYEERTWRSSKFGKPTQDTSMLGWLDFFQWLKTEGKGVVPRDDKDGQVRAEVSEYGTVLIRTDRTLPGSGYLTVGAIYAGQQVVGILSEDPNHGVIALWYPYDKEKDGPGEKLLNAHYFTQGKIRMLNESLAQDRNLGRLDFIKWLENRGEGMVARNNEEGYVLAKVYGHGKVSIRQDPALPHGGYLSVGVSHADKKVVGLLREDPNHGVIALWYLADEEGRPHGRLLNAHHFSKGTLASLNATNARDRRLGWLDLVQWLEGRGEGVRVREGEDGHVLVRVQRNASAFIKSDRTLPGRGFLHVGQEHVEKDVVGLLSEDVNHGVIARWYLADEEGRPHGKLLNVHYFSQGTLVSLNARRASDKSLGWLDFVKWLEYKGEGVAAREGEESYVLEEVNTFGKVAIAQSASLAGWGVLTVGKEYAGRQVVGMLREDPNHGVVARWYIADSEGRPHGRLLNAHYFSNGTLATLNASKAQGRSLGWLDFVKWLENEGKEVAPRADEEGQVLASVNSDGMVLIKQSSSLPHGGRVSVGKAYAGKRVVGMLKEDPNHGMIALWYPYDEENGGPGEELLNVHYFLQGELKILNESSARERSLGWLDFVKWLENKGETITPNEGRAGYVRAKVNANGQVTIKHDASLPGWGILSIGQEHAGKQVVGVLREDPNHGVIAHWYLADQEGHPHGELLNAHYFSKGTLTALNARHARGRRLGWLDFVRWLENKGKDIQPREGKEGHLIVEVNKLGKAAVKQDSTLPGWGVLTVGQEHAGNRVIGLLREDPNHGVIALWYLYDAESGGPQGKPLNMHYFSEGRVVPLNTGRALDRRLGWLDFVKWLRDRGEGITPREGEDGQMSAKVYSDGTVVIKKDSTLPGRGRFTVGGEHIGKKVVGLLARDGEDRVVAQWYLVEDAMDGQGDVLAHGPVRTHWFEDGKLRFKDHDLPPARAAAVEDGEVVEDVPEESGLQRAIRSMKGAAREGGALEEKITSLETALGEMVRVQGDSEEYTPFKEATLALIDRILATDATSEQVYNLERTIDRVLGKKRSEELSGVLAAIGKANLPAIAAAPEQKVALEEDLREKGWNWVLVQEGRGKNKAAVLKPELMHLLEERLKRFRRRAQRAARRRPVPWASQAGDTTAILETAL